MRDVRLPRLMDANLHEKCRLHPLKLSLTECLTPLSTAEMTLPMEDDMPACGDFVELFTAAGSAGLYRVSSIEMRAGRSPCRALTLEHGLCTLADTALFGYHAFDALTTRGVLEALLSRQSRWRLGACEPEELLTYTFENGSLLEALMQVVLPLTKPAYFSYDFSTNPWTLNLRYLPDTPACECRPGRNLSGLSVTVDRSDLCTRIYPLGYGEGADQLTIRDANGGVPYLDADTISAYGVVEKTYADITITDPETLLAAARAMLEKVKQPVMEVEVSAAELSHLTGESLDRFTVGAICRIPFNSQVYMERIVSLHRPDVYGDPADVRLTLANRSLTASGELAELYRKSLVSAVYSQGAASEYAVHFGDNADASHPASLRFYIDEDALHVNKVMVRYEVAPFRGYTKASSGGGRSNVSVTWTEGSLMEVTTSCTETTAVDGQPHSHDVEAEVDLPEFHVSVPSHTHGISLGIYEGSTAGSVTVAVDGNPVPASLGRSFDAVEFLSKDSRGKVRRGAWHEITFTPDGETRITADLHVRTFIRTLTGANL